MMNIIKNKKQSEFRPDSYDCFCKNEQEMSVMKKMKLKRMGAILIAFIMGISVMACGNNGAGDEEGDNQSDGPVTFTAMVTNADPNNLTSEHAGFKLWQETQGIVMEITDEFTADVAEEKANLVINGGEYPEIIYKVKLDMNELGSQGIAIPLEDMIKEYMPNLSKRLDELNAWAEITAPDGHIYSFPAIGNARFLGGSTGILYINQVWLDNLGLERPETMEDFYNVLKAFKEQDANGNGDPNDEIPFNVEQIAETSRGLEKLLSYMGGMYHYLGQYVSVNDDGEMVYLPYTDLYREYLEYATKLYEEGLLYEDFITNSYDEFCAVSMGSEDNILGAVFTNRMNRMLPDEYCNDYIDVNVFDKEHVAVETGVSTSTVCITDKCQNPEAFCAAYDWFYSEEGAMAVANGVEGETYTLNADGKAERVETFQSLSAIVAVPYDSTAPILSETTLSPDVVYDEGHVFGPHVDPVAFSTLKLTEEETEDIKIISSDLSAYITTFAGNVISGKSELNDASWAEFQAELKKMGADKYLEAYQAAYARNLAS